jgi:hypothetical protein
MPVDCSRNARNTHRVAQRLLWCELHFGMVKRNPIAIERLHAEHCDATLYRIR